MSNWKRRKDRADATWKLINKLDEDPALRRACRASPAKARATLKKIGAFTNMPAKVEVRIMEDSAADRDALVTIVLPPAGELPARDGFEAEEYWKCSWPLWSR